MGSRPPPHGHWRRRHSPGLRPAAERSAKPCSVGCPGCAMPNTAAIPGTKQGQPAGSGRSHCCSRHNSFTGEDVLEPAGPWRPRHPRHAGAPHPADQGHPPPAPASSESAPSSTTSWIWPGGRSHRRSHRASSEQAARSAMRSCRTSFSGKVQRLVEKASPGCASMWRPPSTSRTEIDFLSDGKVGGGSVRHHGRAGCRARRGQTGRPAAGRMKG